MAGTPSSNPPVSPLVRWLILVLASIGFAFDIYELLMLPLVGPDALPAMGYPRGSAGFIFWVSMLFYIPAVFGGVFGLMGGYLTDWLGRRRVLTWSILLYAVSAFLAAFSTNPVMLLVLRCGVFVGVCVEFVAAVAWLAELFPDPEQREKALGFTQAFSSFGGLMVAIAYEICKNHGANFLPIITPTFFEWIGTIPADQQHASWRYTLMSGLIPAIPLLVIRPFLPESPIWQQKKTAGTLKRPSFKELFTSPVLRKTSIITMVMFACSYGAAFGAIQQMRNIVPGLEKVQREANEKVAQLTKGKTLPKAELTKLQRKTVNGVAGKVNAKYTKVQELGGLAGRFIFAVLVLCIVSQRWLLRLFQIPGLIITPLVFFFFLTVPNYEFFTIDLSFLLLGELPITVVSLGMFFVGLCTVAQFSFWGNYLPRVYPIHLRGTGESFAANVGGRLIGTSFAAVSLGLAALLQFVVPGKSFAVRMGIAAGSIGLLVYAVGFIMSFLLPEPKGEALEEYGQAEEVAKPSPVEVEDEMPLGKRGCE